MKHLKNYFLIPLFAIGLIIGISPNSNARDVPDSGASCPMILFGAPIDCKKIWCSSTMGMDACGSGYAESQTCTTYKNCK